MKIFLILLLIIIQTIAYGQLRSFKLVDPKDEDLQNVLIMNAGLKEVYSLNTEIQIWSGSNLIQLEVQANQVLKGRVSKFAFAIDRNEVIRRCYHNTEILSPKLTLEIFTRLNEIDTIPSGELIPEWIVVLDDNNYGIELLTR
jgi:hypothetical protein